MEPFVQFVIAWPGEGWVLMAIFRDMELCQAVAWVVADAWALETRCALHVGA
jgi:hypothetical protein